MLRIQDYANGGRRVLLVTEHTVDARQWQHHLKVFEHLLDTAMTVHNVHRGARRCRLHGGTAHELRLQVWGIPAPCGARVLATLNALLAGAALLAPHQVYVVADS